MDIKVVSDELRTAPRSSWQNLIEQVISEGKTVFVAEPTSKNASNSLTQAARTRGVRIHRRTQEVDGEKGMVFWSEAKESK